MARAVETLTIADEIWVATALLHREQPDRQDFTLTEIVERAEREGVSAEHRAGLRPHASRHCVANAAPSPSIHRMLVETGKSTRRLFRPGDPFHPDRSRGKTRPEKEDLPEPYRHLLDWYTGEWAPASAEDPLLALYGTGKGLWPEGADEFVRQLREGWE